MLRYTTDRARPGLVALYDIRPGNGAGLFLQPRSLHGAYRCTDIPVKFPRVIVQTRIVTYTQTNGQSEIEKKLLPLLYSRVSDRKNQQTTDIAVD